MVTAALLLSVSGSGDARADGPAGDKPLAEGLFRQGKALAEEGKLGEACLRFAESQRIEPKLGTLLYLATCHEQTGKLASAWAEFTEAAAIAKRQREPDRVRLASERADKLLPRVPHLRIVLDRDQGATPDVFLDGLKLGEGSLRAELPIDPGPHKVDASRSDAETWSSTIEAREAAIVEVRIPALVPRAARAAPAPSLVTAPPPPLEERASLRPLAIGASALGAIGLAVGTVFGVRYLGQRDDGLGKCDGARCSADGLADFDRARTSSVISTVGFAVGVAGAAACVTLIVLEPAPSTRVGLRLSPQGADARVSW